MGLPGWSPPPVYFPAGIDWDQVLTDPKATIYIVESEKTACLLAKHGFAAVAIGGVNSVTAHKAGFHTLVPDLIKIATPSRPIVVAFDSDKNAKPSVLAAEGSLLLKLADRGAVALKVNIPAPLDGRTKNGPNNFIVERGIAAFSELKPERPGNLVKIYSLASMYGYLEAQDRIVRLEDCHLFPEEHFHRHEAARRFYLDLANGGRKELQASRVFVKSAQRPNFSKLFYAPGEPRLMENRCLNRWTRSYDPVKGAVDKYIAVRDFIFKDSEPGVMHTAECLYAFKAQNPQAKIPLAVFVYGDVQGSGKSLYVMLSCAAWGSGLEPTHYRCNFSKIEARELSSNFNSRWAGCETALGDEITARDKYVLDNELIKDMVTRTSMVVEEKNINAYGARDYIFYSFTSNSPRSMRINSQDRRLFCIHASEEKPKGGILSAGYDWLFKDPTCGPAMAYYWANFDYGDFNPFAETGAPWTKAKDEVVRANVSSVEEEIELFLGIERATPEVIAALGCRADMRLDCCDLWEVADFEKHLANRASGISGNTYQRSLATSNYIREVLKRYGARELPDPIKPPEQKACRVFAIRNQDKWLALRANKDGGHRACVNEYLVGHPREKFDGPLSERDMPDD
jgi:Domain of unknown function (DUF3854)/Family of unknown function (DUF5906)